MGNHTNYGYFLRSGCISALSLVCVSAVLGITSGPAFAGSPVTWSAGASGNWGSGPNWTGGSYPNSAATDAYITDGTSAVTLDVSPSIGNLQIGSGNILTTNLNTTLTVFGPQIVNAGNLNINAGFGTNTILYFGGNTSLSGGGTVTLNPNDGNGAPYIRSSGGTFTLTNVDNLIQGSGIIGDGGGPLTLINQATVKANNKTQSLSINTGNGGVTNTGLLEATNNAQLNLYNLITNTNGNITADGGTVTINGTIKNGTLNTKNGGLFTTNNNATLDGVTLSAGSTYTGDLSTQTTLVNSFVNKGLLQLNAGKGTNSFLYFGSDLALTGGGTVTLNPNDGNGAVYLRSSGPTRTLTNVDNLIQGSGYIGDGGGPLKLVNQATINANNSVQALSINNGNGGVINQGLLEATNSATLNLYNAITNTGANITADKGTVTINGTIQGGILNVKNGGLFTTNNNATLDGVTLSANSTYTGDLSTQTTLVNSFVNKGLLQLNAGKGTNTFLYFGSDLALTGGGTVTLNPNDGNGGVYVRSAGGTHTLTNVDNLIQGSGYIGDGGGPLTFVNQSTVNANNSVQALSINSGNGGVINQGLLEATNSATLNLYNAITNTGANITADKGTVTINGTIQGGTLNVKNGGLFTTNNNATLDGVTLSAGSTYTSDLSTQTTLVNSFVNKGLLQVNAGKGTNTFLYFGSDLALTGGGTVTLNPNDGNGSVYVRSTGGTHTLTNVDNLIQGSGVIGDGGGPLTFVNQSTVNANNSVQALSINNGNGGVTNTGLLEATNGATLNLYNSINNANGNITANTGTVTINGTIQGGTLNTLNGGLFATNNNATLDGVTLSAGSTYVGGLSSTTALLNTINNSGLLQFNGGQGTNTFLYLGGDVSLTGGGTVTLNPTDGNGTVFVRSAGGTHTLTNVDNLIQGSGVVGDSGGPVNFVNGKGGTLLANGTVGILDIGSGGGAFTNNGTVKVLAGSTLKVTGDANGFLQSSVANSTPITQVDGNLIAPNGVNIQAGILEGSGAISGNVVNGAIVHPGDSPGILTINGNYTQQSTGSLAITLAGLAPGSGYSQLQVNGKASLAGALDVSLANNFTLTANDTFTILNFTSLTGDFTSLEFSGASCGSLGIDSWACSGGKLDLSEVVNPTSLELVVTSVSAVPLPGALPLFGTAIAGLVGFGVKRARRSNAA